MGKKSKITIKDEERLAEEVRGYRVIYMKDHDDHKDRNIVLNAWRSIANTLEFTTIEEARSAFSRLKKKYLEKRNKLRKLKRSGAGRKQIELAEKQLKKYEFMTWINQHTSLPLKMNYCIYKLLILSCYLYRLKKIKP